MSELEVRNQVLFTKRNQRIIIEIFSPQKHLTRTKQDTYLTTSYLIRQNNQAKFRIVDRLIYI